MENEYFVIEDNPKSSMVPSVVKVDQKPTVDTVRVQLIEDIFEVLRDRLINIISTVAEDDEMPFEESSPEDAGFNMAVEVMMDILDETEGDFIEEFNYNEG